MQVALVMFKSDGSRRDFPIVKPRTVIGRSNTSDLRVPLSSVSREHCELTLGDDGASVRDLGSSNGTYHNHIRVQEARLSAGDEVQVGPVVFTVVINGKPERPEPAGSASGRAAVPSAPESLSDKSGSQVIDVSAGELPAHVEAEEHSPTVDIDDPIAALEAMARRAGAEDEEMVIPMDDDDDEPPKSGRKR